MLLLVLQPQFHQGLQFCRRFIAEQLHQPSVDLGPPLKNLANGWPAQDTPLRTGVSFPHRLVIGIELIAPAGVAGDMAGEMRLKNEGVEKPSGVS